jgi:MFS family permease
VSGIGGASFRLTLGATLLGFGGFALLLPVVPLWAARGGATAFGAGVTTGALLLATVVTQLAVPWLLTRIGHRWVLGLGLVLIGAPAPLLALSAAAAPVIAVSALRGVGFGLLTVAGSALVAELVPAESHGRANAWFGAAIGAPQLVLLGLGVAVVDHVGFAPLFVAGGAAPVLGAVMVPFIKLRASGEVPVAAVPGGALPSSAPGPLVGMVGCAVCQGALVTFLPLAVPNGASTAAAALLGMSAGGLFGRVVAGLLVDRFRLRGRLVAPATLLAALGTGLQAVFLLSAPALVVVGAALVGLGFGAVQNDSLTALFAAYGPARYGTASAAWNIAYDGGTGIGAIGLGALADPFGFRVAFGVVAVLCAVAGVVAVRPGRRSGGRARRRQAAGARRS